MKIFFNLNCCNCSLFLIHPILWTHLAVHTGCRSLGWCRFVLSVRCMLARPGSHRTRHRLARQAATAGWCWWRVTCPPSTSRTRLFSWDPPRAWLCTANTQQSAKVKTRILHIALLKIHRSSKLLSNFYYCLLLLLLFMPTFNFLDLSINLLTISDNYKKKKIGKHFIIEWCLVISSL